MSIGKSDKDPASEDVFFEQGNLDESDIDLLAEIKAIFEESYVIEDKEISGLIKEDQENLMNYDGIEDDVTPVLSRNPSKNQK